MGSPNEKNCNLSSLQSSEIPAAISNMHTLLVPGLAVFFWLSVHVVVDIERDTVLDRHHMPHPLLS